MAARGYDVGIFAALAEEGSFRHLERLVLAQALYEQVRQRLVREIVLTNPTAGVDWTTTVPAGVTWEPLGIQATYTAPAVVATRVADLQIRTQDNVGLERMPAPSSIAASGQIVCLWAVNNGALANTAGVAIAALGVPRALSGGYTIKSNTFNIDTGDQWSSIRVIVREWTPSRVVQVCETLLADLDSAGGPY